jgi:hypothetical protein
MIDGGRRAEPLCGPSIPVGAHGAGFAGEMDGDDFGEESSVLSGPLDGVQDIGVLGGTLLERVAAVGETVAVPELEEADGDIAAVLLEGDSGGHGEWGRDGETAAGVLVVGFQGAVDKFAPGVVAGAVATVDAPDAVGIGGGPVEPLASHGREPDVGVEVKDPVVAAKVGQAEIDGAGFGERGAVVMKEIGGAAFDAQFAAKVDGLPVVFGGDNEVVIEMAEIVREGFGEEIGVEVADSEGFESSHGGRRKWKAGTGEE